MSELCVKWKKIEENGKEIEQLSAELKKIEGELEQVKSNLSTLGKYKGVTSSIVSIIREINKEEKCAKSMGTKLNEIGQMYQKTEKKIVNEKCNVSDGKAGTKGKPETGNSTQDEKFDWKEFIDDFMEALKKEFIQHGYSMQDFFELSSELGWGVGKSVRDGLFGKKDMGAAFEEWLKGFIQNNIHDESFLAVYAALAAVSVIPSKTRKEHLTNNEKAWAEHSSEYCDSGSGGKYIEHQSKMKDVLYGEGVGYENTCGVIATYNALVSLNNGQSPESFADMLNYFEGNGIALYGYVGTDPGAIENYFDNNGYETKMLSGDSITSANISDMQSNYDTYIITSYNNVEDISDAVHTMCITEENGKYVLHNDYSGKRIEGGIEQEHFSTYSSLEEAIMAYNGGKSEPISVIGIANS